MRSLLLSLALLLPAVAVAQDLPVDLVAKSDALSPADEAKKFKLPPGFTAQLVAAEPDIQKPMQMCFDPRGRLWVTTSYLYPFAAEPGKGTDKLFVLSDFDATGKAKKVEVFDDKLNIPIGVLPLPDGKSVIVSECGKILKLTDTDGDGKADKREDLFTGFGFRDTHGMYNSYTLLPDGWVYACHGYLNDSTVKGKDGHEVKMNSGNTFRFKPDGSRIEVFTRGQVNPFGMCVDPWLNIYTADCHSRPMTQLIRGAHYDSFGKPHDGLGYAPHVINHMHGSTGLCGLTYYAADHFPKEWTGVMFVGNCVTSRVNCDRIQWKGSTPVGKELPDFLVSDDPWFRPVDLKIGPDGAMYVSDFYNKIIGHYEVDLKHPGRDKGRGRIWRIVYTGTDGKAPAPTCPRQDWTKAGNEELLSDFGHPNTTVRLLAANEAASRASFKPDGANVLADAERLSFRMGLYAMVAERTGEMNLDGYQTVIDFAKKNPHTMPPEHLSGLVVRALVSRKGWGEKERAIALNCFKSFDNIRVRRAVIDGFTAHPHADFVEVLLDLVPTIPAEDTHLSMAARVALRNCVVAAGGVDKVVELTTKGDKDGRTAALFDVALAIRAKESAKFLATHFTAKRVSHEQRVAAAELIGRLQPDLASFVTEAFAKQDREKGALQIQLSDPRGWHGCVQSLLRGMQAGGVMRLPGVVAEAIDAAVVLGLSPTQGPDVALLAATSFKLSAPFRKPGPDSQRAMSVLHAIQYLADTSKPVNVRAELLDGVAPLKTPQGERLMRQLFGDSETPMVLRQRCMQTLLASPSVSDCTAAKDVIKTAPYSLAVATAAALAADKFGADLLLASVKNGEVPGRLLQEKAVVDRLKATKVPDLDAKLKELTKNLPPAEKRLDDLIKARAAGFPKAKTDVELGKAVFTKNCAVCHQLNNEGAKVGPQLDGVGIRGLERLLEDTLDPNRNVDQAFRATKLDLKDGRNLTGLLLREEGEVYVLADAQGKEQRIPKADVDQKATANTSAMPANLDTVMTEAEYYHLLRFLLEQKVKK